MADLIQIKGGAKGSREQLPKLSPRELGYCTDEGNLYIGSDSGNLFLCSTNKAVAVTELSETAGTSEMITTINSILTSLKNAGVMNT